MSQNHDFQTFFSQETPQKEKIGDYAIEKTVGQGTFGKVKLATHMFTGEKVAVKILQKNKILDEGDKIRIFREIRILKQLKHPNLIHLYEIIENKTDIYLIMEYAANGELYDLIVKKKKLPESEAFFFFQQILSGVEYLHKLNISHRDLKLENLLLSYNNTLKIVDFGLSNFFDSNPLLLTSCGSPCYAAPEMILGERYNGQKSDIWSLGIILFAMTCGYLPFENKDTSIMYRKVVKGEYEIPKFLSEELKILLRGMLTVDPKKRFSIGQIKKCAWYMKFKTNNENEGVIFGTHEIPMDEFILDVLENFNVDRKQTEEHLQKNRHNRFTSLYYLLLEKYIREGGKSGADLNSSSFIPKTLVSEIILEDSAEKTKRKFIEKSRSPTNKNLIDVENEKMSSPNQKTLPEIRRNIETSPEITSSHLKQNSLDSGQKMFSFKTQESLSVNSPEMRKMVSKTMQTSKNSPQVNTIMNSIISQDSRNEAINEKPFVGFQSDRFEKPIASMASKSGDTIRKLEKVLNESKLSSKVYEKLRTEGNSTKNNQLKQMFKNAKSNKSYSFYQTKFLLPQPPIHPTKNKNSPSNLSNSLSISQNTKSFHQKNQSQALRDKKGSTPKKQNNEKTEITTRNTKSKSIDTNNSSNNNKIKTEDGDKKILNVTLMALRKSNQSFSRNGDERREKSVSIEKIRENIDRILISEKNSNQVRKSINTNPTSWESNPNPNFFSTDSTNQKMNVSQQTNTSENNRKSYYQLAYLLKDKNFANKYNVNPPKDDRTRFKSMYTGKKEATQKSGNQSNQNNKPRVDNSDRSRSNSRSQSQIKKKIECQLNSLKMFTLTKREEKDIENSQKIEIKPEKSSNLEKTKNILNTLKNKKPVNSENKIDDIENFLRYSQKFKDLKAMQKDLEKLLTSG